MAHRTLPRWLGLATVAVLPLSLAVVTLLPLRLAAQDDPVPMLIDKLENSDSFRVRTQAAAVLGRLRDARATDSLIERLRGDESYAVRGAAAGALGHIGGVRAVEPLFDALNDGDSFVQSTAEDALGKVQGEGVAATLRTQMIQGDQRVQRLAFARIVSLAEAGDREAAGALISALEVPALHDEAEMNLLELPSTVAVPALMPALEDEKDGTRALAVRMLARRPSKQVAELLAKVYERPGEVEAVKGEVRKALASMRGHIDAEALIEVALQGDDQDVRARAVRLLGAVGEPTAVKAFEELLGDPDPYLQRTAAMALADARAHEAVPRMKKLRASTRDERLKSALDLAIKRLQN